MGAALGCEPHQFLPCPATNPRRAEPGRSRPCRARRLGRGARCAICSSTADRGRPGRASVQRGTVKVVASSRPMNCAGKNSGAFRAQYLTLRETGACSEEGRDALRVAGSCCTVKKGPLIGYGHGSARLRATRQANNRCASFQQAATAKRFLRQQLRWVAGAAGSSLGAARHRSRHFAPASPLAARTVSAAASADRGGRPPREISHVLRRRRRGTHQWPRPRFPGVPPWEGRL